MNQKAQTGVITLFFLLAVFVVMWALFLGSWLSQIGADAIAVSNLTGFEAFIWGNLNMAVLLGVLAAGAGGIFLAGGTQ